jgi:hypothetical protein
MKGSVAVLIGRIRIYRFLSEIQLENCYYAAHLLRTCALEMSTVDRGGAFLSLSLSLNGPRNV